MLGYRATRQCTSVPGLPLASAPASGHKGPPSQGRVSCGRPERPCFLLWALVLRNSRLPAVFLTISRFSSALFFLKSLKADLSVQVLIWLLVLCQKTSIPLPPPPPRDFPLAPAPCISYRKQRLRQGAQVAASRTSGLSPPQCSPSSQCTCPLVSGRRLSGATVRTTVVV